MDNIPVPAKLAFYEKIKKALNKADWAENDHTFKMSFMFSFRRRNITQPSSREAVPLEKTTVALRKPQIFSTVAHHIESIQAKAASTS